MFKCIGMGLFWIYGFCGISLWVLLNPFIEGLWLNSNFVLSEQTVFVFFLNFITGGMLTIYSIFVEATGQFSRRGFAAIASAAVNVILSIVFLKVTNWGIAGVILATVFARILVVVPAYLKILSKDIFSKKTWKFWGRYWGTLGLTIITGLVIKGMTSFWVENTIINVLIKGLFCVVIVNSSWFLIFRKTEEFAYLVRTVKNVIIKIREKN